MEQTLTPARTLSVLQGIAAGMTFLHAHSVIHRDLKSANVLFNRQLQVIRTKMSGVWAVAQMISRNVSCGQVKLCDFAFSKFKLSGSSAGGGAASAAFDSTVGTPAWMAPEVLRGDAYTMRGE